MMAATWQFEIKIKCVRHANNFFESIAISTPQGATYLSLMCNLTI